MSIRERVKGEIKDPRLRESSYLDTAILDVLESGTRTDNGEIPVASVVDKLDELHRENGTAENTTTERRPGREERRARATRGITNTEVVAAISLEVEKLRGEWFRNSEPPFSTVADAAAWVEAESAEDWERHKKTPSAKALEDIERLRQEYGPLEEVQIKTVMLPYQRPDSDHQKSVPTAPHTYLRLLANVTSRIASRTGLYQDALVMYLLTGFEPERRRASVKTTESTYAPYPSGPQLRTNHVEVSFYVRDLTEKQLRDIYNSVRGHITGLNRKAQIEETQARIYELVHEHGGPWRDDWEHGDKAKLLRAVLADARKEGLTYVRNGEERLYSTTRGIESAYLAAHGRLEPPR